ncbi:arginase [Vibrio sp. SM6]|uniref:Arginase n=1 Tax=Vibrio agarilyticus TaxID=2726741 RepID=A0A7X8YIG8_9VIBR|nr:arginase [Vibrio agarilyticus]NLS14561.1 arginase [Vibrio agarilyticus]
MFGFIGHYRKKLFKSASARTAPYCFIIASQQLHSMGRYEYDKADQSLENANEWLLRHPHMRSSYIGHFAHDAVQNGALINAVQKHAADQALVVMLTNSSETMLSLLPSLMSNIELEAGLIHIGHRMPLEATLEVKVGSAYHFALSRYSKARAFFCGLQEPRISSVMRDYAEDLDCHWLTDSEFQLLHKSRVKQHIAHILEHSERIIVTLDLASLVPSHSVNIEPKLDLNLALATLSQCIDSGKVALVQLVGNNDDLIYSKACRAIIDELHLRLALPTPQAS